MTLLYSHFKAGKSPEYKSLSLNSHVLHSNKQLLPLLSALYQHSSSADSFHYTGFNFWSYQSPLHVSAVKKTQLTSYLWQKTNCSIMEI